MAMMVTPLTPDFCAEITGIDITLPLDEAEFTAIRAAFDRWSVLIFPEQPLDDASQIAFSENFGPLEPTRSVNPAAGTPFARQSNLDIETGAVIPADDRRMAYQKANMLWHSDSTFKAVLSLCSVLSAREVPPVGGATQFASTRAAYEGLDEPVRARLKAAVVEHDFSHSRALVGFEFTAQEAAPFPAVRHRLVRVNANSGRKSVLIGAHAKLIVGWKAEESRDMLDDLLARAQQHAYSHEWRQGDVVIWDNQAALHRPTPYDSVRHRRLMQRTTISSRNEADAP